MNNQRKEQVRLLFRPNVLRLASARAEGLNLPLSVYVEAAVDAYNQHNQSTQSPAGASTATNAGRSGQSNDQKQ